MEEALDGDMAEAVFMVLADLTLALVENGALKKKDLHTMQAALRIHAEEATVRQKRCDFALASDLAGTLAAIVDGPHDHVPSPHPHLRLVQSPDKDGGGKQ